MKSPKMDCFGCNDDIPMSAIRVSQNRGGGDLYCSRCGWDIPIDEVVAARWSDPVFRADERGRLQQDIDNHPNDTEWVERLRARIAELTEETNA